MNELASVDKYPFTIRPLSTEDGGGYLIESRIFRDVIQTARRLKKPSRTGATPYAHTF